MKILFLDIDGVVNCSFTKERHRGALGIDPYMAMLVKRIIAATGCKVVLSSTWRLWEDAREEVRSKVCDFISVTPRLFEGAYAPNERGYEIKEWIHAWNSGPILREDIDNYAILDDRPDMLPYQPFFKTEMDVGLTEPIADAVIAHLNAPICRP